MGFINPVGHGMAKPRQVNPGVYLKEYGRARWS